MVFRLLTSLFFVVGLALGVQDQESEKRWQQLGSKTIRTLEELRAHNRELPLPPKAIDTGLKIRVLTYNIHNFRGYPEQLGKERWKRDPDPKLALPLRALGMLDAHVASLQECFHDKELQRTLVESLGYR